MNKNRLERLNQRRIDNDVITAKMMNEAYRNINQSEAVKYVIGAMQPIDPEYTKNTFVQGDRVINQLKTNLETACEYKYQGSVTNDTHIKAKSDIDILELIGKFYTLEPPQVVQRLYQGEPIDDLLDLRKESISVLTAAFPQATVDTSSSKCITISGGSLTREIDVVPSNWMDTVKYGETKNEIYRAVQILDSKNRIRITNTPFLHNACIDYKDSQTQGGLRKAARLLKSLKYDSDAIEISSYDLVSIAFNLENSKLIVGKGEDLKILGSCIEFCSFLEFNETYRNSLSVPDGHRKIFCEGHASLKGLKQLNIELNQLSNDILNENVRSFKKLEEARVIFN